MVDSGGTKTLRIPKGQFVRNKDYQYRNQDWFLFGFVWFASLRPINNLSVKQGWFFLGWTSTKLGCVLLKEHNAVTPVRLEPTAPRSRVEHSTTEPLLSRIKIEVELNISTTFAWSCQKGTAWCPSYYKTTTHVYLIDVCTMFKTSHQQLPSYGDWTQA